MAAEFAWEHNALLQRDEKEYVELRYQVPHPDYEALRYQVPHPDYEAPRHAVEVDEQILRGGFGGYHLPADTVVEICAEDYVDKLERDGFVPQDEPWPLTFKIYSPVLREWLEYSVAAEFKPRFYGRRIHKPGT